ncbi:aldehyde dehydrogenase family protein [Belliella kenyensis]|uniref:Aldehyde dehydrogenase family protein n=1 Tax=Belliella kenyensis TaxID=1472724 RepID=A0ABV8EQ42_9BACT|nr:aldehyde dehydrogenase family protein [Belliella kenyensis]MCH7402177.1 aldehyde dehydrogenase family protein [Belliella kenyensis]MDN3601692.1 aldehyde dehydrogenase family protein [Belliella kenyensis]
MSNQKLEVFNPYNLKLIKEISVVGKEEVKKALETAHTLFLDRSKWIPAHERIEILEKVQEIMKSKVEELTKTAAEEGGKPYQDSKVEVLRAINGVKIASEEIARLNGEQIPMGITASSVGRIAFTTREPIGVVASISAFNHPLNLIIHQTVTAFAAGCPVIVKPASTTPLSCLSFVEILKEAGVPEGWVQCLIMDNEAAETVVTDKRINYLSFIGSAKIGWYLKSKLAPGTRCALEHGGAAPVIVEPDANIEDMIPALAKGGFYHAGQVCVSVQKVYAHESIARKVAEQIASAGEKMKVGDPLDEDTEVGPLILPKEVDRVEEWVEEAKSKGGEILSGGKRISDTCYAPTVIFNPPQNVKVSQEEIFGPVVCVYSYSDRLEAIESANSLDYHFQAAVFTQDIDIALDTVQRLNATAVMVNDHTAFRVDWMPFGGRDSSGEGLGGIPYSMHEMTREKLMVIKSKLL